MYKAQIPLILSNHRRPLLGETNDHNHLREFINVGIVMLQESGLHSEVVNLYGYSTLAPTAQAIRDIVEEVSSFKLPKIGVNPSQNSRSTLQPQ